MPDYIVLLQETMRANYFRTTFKSTVAYGNYEDLVLDPNIDAI